MPRQTPSAVAAFFGDMVALAGVALLVLDVRVAVAGGSGVPVATDGALIVAGVAAHLTARSRGREARAGALVLLVLAACPAVLFAHRTWLTVAAGVCVAVLAPHLLVRARARLWIGAGTLLALTALEVGWLQAVVASAGVVVAGLLSLKLARRLGGAAVHAAQESQRVLDAEREKAADLEVRVSRFQGGQPAPRRSFVRVAFTRRLGAMGAIATVVARDLRLAADAGGERLRDVALRSASHADHLARLAAGGAAREEKVTLGLLWPRISELLGDRIQATHHVRWKVPTDLPPLVGSAPEWTHILSALVENALEAMAGGGVLTIEAAAGTDARRARVVVTDNGPGIPPELLPRVLEPFHTTQADEGAKGLGLALVASMIETLGGTIAVSSTPGHGTTVELTVPFHTAAAPAAAPGAPGPALRLEGVVLLADDNKDLRRALRRLLEGFGLQVAEADSGTTALALFSEAPDRFRAIILDVVMEGTPAEEVVVRARELRADIPVVLVSGYDVRGLLEGVIALGGVRFLAKPLVPETVFSTLRDLFTVRDA